MIITHRLFGRPIICQVTDLNGDISVLLYGGDKSHIGAVSIAGADTDAVTHSFPGHKEGLITQPWAEKIAAKSGKHVCVQAGIHYNNVTEEMIREIMTLTEAMLEEVLEHIEKTDVV